ncbi:MAG: histone deacetylase [Parachlamydiaceae bacterium]|nr:histone deacetylase [Parachlamydiaceae bacterium]
MSIFSNSTSGKICINNFRVNLNTNQALDPCLDFTSIPQNRQHKWMNKLIGFIKFSYKISLISTIVETIAKNWLEKKQISIEKPNSIKEHSLNQKPDSQNMKHRVVFVANKEIFMKHITGKTHPEAPQRVEAIENSLRQANIMKNENTIKPRRATIDEISLCHDKRYQKELEKQIINLQEYESLDSDFDTSNCKVTNVPGDFKISFDTLETSQYAAGAPLTAIEYILDEKNNTSRAFCIVRPPGHHAHEHTGSGFCVFNNVAIAAKHLTKNLGFKRVLIVDWDAHHGDGTQKLTESDGRIFYFSTHKDTSTGFYPGPHWGSANDTGGNEQRSVLNCPVYGSKDQCRKKILEAFHNQLVPAMEQFKPDFVLISCGFDAHENDSLVGLGLKDEDYKELTNTCINIAEKHAKGRIVSVLEGGYNLDAISGAAIAHARALS